MDINTRFETYNTMLLHGNAWKNNYEMQAADEYFNAHDDTSEIANRLNLTSFWRPNRENAKMTVADVLYRRKLRHDSLETAPGVKYKNFGGQEQHNHLKFFEDTFFPLLETIDIQPLSIQDYLPAIYRCFSANTLEEVFERLKYESAHGETVWANATLKTLSERSPLSLELTFQLIKKAYHLEWHECLQQEFKIAMKLVSHPDFFEGASKVLSRITSTPEWNTKFPIPHDEILSYLENSPSLDLKAKQNELLPVKEYFREIPNSPRFWINEISPKLAVHRGFFNLEVQSFYNAWGFDLRDFNIEIAKVREKVYYSMLFRERLDEEMDRVERVSSDPLTLRMYVEQRMQEIERFVSNENEFKKTMDLLLEEAFRKRYEERVKMIKERSEEAHNIKKREFLKELKDLVAEKRFLEGLETPEDMRNTYEFPVMQPVPMIIPTKNNESYLPPIAEAKYPQYPAPKNHIYTADFATTDDASLYYATPTPKFTAKSSFNIQKIKDHFSKIYYLITKEIWNLQRREIDKIHRHYNENQRKLSYEIIDKVFKQKPEEKSSQADNFLKRFHEYVTKIEKNVKEFKDIKESLGNECEVVDFNDKAYKKLVSPNYDHTQGVNSAHMGIDAENDEKAIVYPKMPREYTFENGSHMSETENNKLIEGNEEALLKVTEIFEDIYVKTGCTDPKQGLHMLKTGEFTYDPEAMRERRRVVSTSKFINDDRHFLPNFGRKGMKQLFHDIYITPGLHEIDKELLDNLELENPKFLLSELKGASDSRGEPYDPEIKMNPRDHRYRSFYNRIINNQEKKNVKLLHFPQRVKLDADYLKMIFGDKTYVPMEADFSKEDLEIPKKELGLCKYEESPQDWVINALKLAIQNELEIREKEERLMNRIELMAYDRELNKKFTADGARLLLIEVLNQESAAMAVANKGKVEKYREKAGKAEIFNKPQNDFQDYLNENQQFLLTWESYKLRNYAKGIMDKKQKKKDIFQNLLKSDTFFDVLKHEKKENIVEKVAQEPDHYLERWMPKSFTSVEEKELNHRFRKRALSDLQSELKMSVKVIKAMQLILEKYEYRSKVPDDLPKFNKILEKNKGIL